MASSKQKGDKFELKVKKDLEDKEWLVMKSPRTMRFIGKGRFISQANDFFGLYDLVAKKNNMTMWIQCKYGSNHIYDKRKEMEEFYKKYCSITEMVIIATQEPRAREIRYIQYDAKQDKWVE